MSCKRTKRLEINKLVNEFLAKGGKIQIIKMGQRGKCLPKQDDVPNRMNPTKQTPTGNRCKICDWSSTDRRSISNPEVSEYRANQLVIDDLTGDMFCRVCLSHVARMNRDFKIEQDPGYGTHSDLLSQESLEFLSSTSYLSEMQGRQSVVHDGRVVPGVFKKSHASGEDT